MGAFLLIGVYKINVYTNVAVNIEQLINKELAGLGFELIGLEFDGHRNSKVIRIFADTAAQNEAITVADCGKINKHLNRVLGILPDFQATNYSLEVSSPGVDRRLFTLQQAEQYIGKEIKVKLKSPLYNRSNFIGILQAVNHVTAKLSIEVEEQIYEFDFMNIYKANLVYCKFN